MGSVLLMLLALVLPVAPATAQVGPRDVAPNNIQDSCGPASDGTTQYFLTLKGTNGVPLGQSSNAVLTLIPVGTANLNTTPVPLIAGDLERQALPGVDGNNDGDCIDVGIDILPGQNQSNVNDGNVNDWTTAQPVVTALVTNLWRLQIDAPGYASRSIFLTLDGLVGGGPLIDGRPAAAPFFGTGCLLPNHGCVVSLGVITLVAAAAIPPITPRDDASRYRISDECALSPNNTTSYYLTLTSTTGTRIPAR
jgi:hypothetical protein